MYEHMQYFEEHGIQEFIDDGVKEVLNQKMDIHETTKFREENEEKMKAFEATNEKKFAEIRELLEDQKKETGFYRLTTIKERVAEIKKTIDRSREAIVKMKEDIKKMKADATAEKLKEDAKQFDTQKGIIPNVVGGGALVVALLSGLAFCKF